jgi:ribonucleoside-diphosphate reductase alpha chain
VLASLRWPGRPDLSGGNPAWTYMIEHPQYRFAVFVGHVENGRPHAFEVWVNGSEQPRGLGALAKTLSMDMRAEDSAWLKLKLDTLAKTGGDEPFEMPFPPKARRSSVPFRGLGLRADRALARRQLEAGMADEVFRPRGRERLLAGARRHVRAQGAEDRHRRHHELDRRRAQPAHRRRLRARAERNYAARRHHAALLRVASGEYPRSLDGLCKMLSLDMRVLDPAWLGMKLKKLLDFPSRSATSWPSSRAARSSRPSRRPSRTWRA